MHCFIGEATAIVALGNVRDASDLVKQNCGLDERRQPVGCFMIPPQKKDYEEIVSKYRKPFEGAIAVCDDTGVVLIPKNSRRRSSIRSWNSSRSRKTFGLIVSTGQNGILLKWYA